MITEPARLVVTLQTATHRFHRDLRNMMRPFVVMPAELMPFMDLHMGRDHMADMKYEA